MAIARVKQAAGNTGTTTPTSVTPSLGSASTTGNLLVLVMASDATVATPSGWSVARPSVGNAGHYVFYKTSAGETSFTVTVASAATCWWIIELSGQNSASPVDGVNSSSTTTPSTGNVTTNVTPTLVQTDEYGLATWCSTGVSNPAASWSAETNGYVEIAADQSTTKTSTTNIGLAVAEKLGPLGTTESSTATPSTGTASQAIIVTFRAATAAAAVRPGLPNRRFWRAAHRSANI